MRAVRALANGHQSALALQSIQDIERFGLGPIWQVMAMATPPRVSPAGSPQVRLAPEGEEEPPADPFDTNVQDAPARLRHRSEEHPELPDEAGE